MTRMIITMMAVVTMSLMAGCASKPAIPPLLTMAPGNLPAANTVLNIPGLGPCTDNPDRSLHLSAQQPLTVLVHGCFASAGRFRGLAQVLAFHGQQTACFTYNDRDSLMHSSAQLISALEQAGQGMQNQHLTVIGHSQGALIARKALVADRPGAINSPALALRLVTISGPFDGIAAASHCGSPALRLLSLGLVNLTCNLVTGEKWSEITYSSDFIRHPGTLSRQVQDYLKIVTDERGSCRRLENGVCTEKDYVFSLAEQYNQLIDRDPITRNVEVKVGHVEIVGDNRVEPVKLIALLQQNGILNPTEPGSQAALQQLLAKLYGGADQVLPLIEPGQAEPGQPAQSSWPARLTDN